MPPTTIYPPEIVDLDPKWALFSCFNLFFTFKPLYLLSTSYPHFIQNDKMFLKMRITNTAIAPIPMIISCLNCGHTIVTISSTLKSTTYVLNNTLYLHPMPPL